jgi:hypothetical protein
MYILNPEKLVLAHVTPDTSTCHSFRVGFAKGEWHLVLDNILKLYSLCPKNRRSLIVFEAINAIRNCSPHSIIIIEMK